MILYVCVYVCMYVMYVCMYVCNINGVAESVSNFIIEQHILGYL